jgi:hypothetical protein
VSDGTSTRTTSRHVIGDTPQRGKYLIYDGEHTTEVEGGLAFALGVAVMEAELCRDAERFWWVQHPNGVTIYHVCTDGGDGNIVLVNNIGSNPHATAPQP